MIAFRRLVLELGQGAADLASIQQAAEMARILGAELHALFVEDDTLLHASGMPFAREISPLSLRWRPLETNRLKSDLHVAAEQARRHLAEAARLTGVRQHFEVRRGDLSVHVSETCVDTDIVVVASPRQEAMHATRRFDEAARNSAAALLFLPRTQGPAHGPVIAIVTSEADPSRALAERLAVRMKEPVIVVTADKDITMISGHRRERMIVMTRDAIEDGANLAATRGVPVLVLEPGT